MGGTRLLSTLFKIKRHLGVQALRGYTERLEDLEICRQLLQDEICGRRYSGSTFHAEDAAVRDFRVDTSGNKFSGINLNTALGFPYNWSIVTD